MAQGHGVVLNCEPASRPEAFTSGHPLAIAKERFSVMFEITERGLLDHPSALLEKVEGLRGQGFLIALDDVGISPDSSALLDIIAPDVIKLDLTLAQSQPDYQQAQTLSSVIAHHERTGAMILAEGSRPRSTWNRRWRWGPTWVRAICSAGRATPTATQRSEVGSSAGRDRARKPASCHRFHSSKTITGCGRHAKRR